MLIYGIHTIEAFLKRRPEQVKALFLVHKNGPRLQAIETVAKAEKITIQNISEKTLGQKLGQVNHQGVVAEISMPEILEAEFYAGLENENPSLVLILDGVQDPHNLGACIRNADAFGAAAILIPKDNSCPVNETVHRVASGASANVPVIAVSNLSRSIQQLQKLNFWVYGFDDEAKTSLYQAQFSQRAALVLGSEGQGIRKLVKENCDFLLNIPMQGIVSSLNVSSATAVCLAEARRQLSH